MLTIVNPFGAPASNHEGSSVSAEGAVAIVGASLSVELRELWAFEVGGKWLLTSVQGTGHDLFARAGVAPMIQDSRRADGRGWTTQFDALLGYRALKRYDAPDGHAGTELTHGVRADVGLELIHHWRDAGFGVRFLTGLTLPIAQTRTGEWERHSYFDTSQDLQTALDIGLDLTLSLHD